MSESKLVYYLISRSKLIPFAVAASSVMRKPKTTLAPLRLTNTGEGEASVAFNNLLNGGATQLQFRRDETAAFEDWDLSALTIEPGGYIEFAGDNSETQGPVGAFTMLGESIAASGNIMSLIYGEKTSSDPLVIPDGIDFSYLFEDCEILTTAPMLPATTLTNECYSYMFNGCISLTAAPELPATTLQDNCYRAMFKDCASLITAPELPATVLAEECYALMFQGCTSLTTAPALPATTLAYYCYSYMFRNCTGLTAAPELPATVLADMCYNSMFYGCTSLTTAPVLPATALVGSCYSEMFYGCTSLSAITVAFTEWSEEATGYWVKEVAASGTFTCPASLDATQFDDSHIPSGWSVVTV